MEKKLYDLMDWAEIETIVYSEHDHPEQVLGAHKVRGGILIQTFLPGAETVFVKNERDRKLYQMTEVDEEGFFAILLSGKKIPSYVLIAQYGDGREQIIKDPYSYSGVIREEDRRSLSGDRRTALYQRLGAHPVKVVGQGQNVRMIWEKNTVSRKRGEQIKKSEAVKRGEPLCDGTYFAIWAPGAMRVSVVGDFNQWDGRVHPMIRQGESDVFSLFIPETGCGELYKFEIKWNVREMELQSDPYGFSCEVAPSDASIVADLREYEWNDDAWMKNRKGYSCEKKPLSICEVYLEAWKRETGKEKIPEQASGEEGYENYREIAPRLAEYLEEMGYTHVELLPIMEYISEESLGYETTGYYAPTARYGKPQDFMFFVDYLHQKGIGVILDWTAVRKYCREGADLGDFLVANALFWKDCYHIDGIRVTGMESILGLDNGKTAGNGMPNQYGMDENLEGISFFRKLSEQFHRAGDGALLIAEDASAYPGVTEAIEDGGLGFDLKWNGGWTGDFLDYLATDPLFRKGKHSNLLWSMLYAYSEKFVLLFSHNQLVDGVKTLLMRMPGEREQKQGNLRVALGYMMTHPGKKLLYMGQDWQEKEDLWIKNYVKHWNRFYRMHPALYELDHQEQGFEWISCMDADHSIIAFLRRSRDEGEELLVVCNFTPVLYENFHVGAPYAGTYEEIFNSDEVQFGGSGFLNSRRVVSKEVAWDGREHSLSINVPPLGITVFRYIPEKEENV